MKADGELFYDLIPAVFRIDTLQEKSEEFVYSCILTCPTFRDCMGAQSSECFLLFHHQTLSTVLMSYACSIETSLFSSNILQ